MSVTSPPSPLPKPTWRGLSHQWGFFVALAAGLVLVIGAPGGASREAAAVYSASLCAMLGASALYHRGNWSPRGLVWARRLDHSMIFVLVAGTYTPFAWLLLDGTLRVVVLTAAWSLASAGILVTTVWTTAPSWVRSALYLTLGWGGVALAPGVVDHAGVMPLVLLLAGGLLYSVGAVVYVRRRPDPAPATFGYHEVFHVFVLGAAVLHWLAVAGYAVQLA